MNWAALGKAAATALMDKQAAQGLLALLLGIVMAPLLIVAAVTGVLLKVPATGGAEAQYKQAVEAVACDKGIEIDWREVVAAATVLCHNNFSQAPDPPGLVQAWVDETWEPGPPGYPPVVHYAVRPFDDVLAALGFPEEDISYAYGYLDTLKEGGS